MVLYVPSNTKSTNLDIPKSLTGQPLDGMIVNPILWIVYLGILFYYISFQIKLYRNGTTLNGSKLFYMGLIVPLHFLAFIHPILAFFVVPLVTVGHNIQYHMIVYSYGQKKYYGPKLSPETVTKYHWTRFFFKNAKIYFTFGLIFTLLLYRGPLFDGLFGFSGLSAIIPNDLNRTVFNSIGMMAGIRNPSELSLGELVFGSCLSEEY